MVSAAVGAVLWFLRHMGREAGVADGRGGAVAIVQRFGGALNLNLHLHLFAIDGVFARLGDGVAFWPAPSLTDLDVGEVLRPTRVHGRGAGPAAAPTPLVGWHDPSALRPR